MSYGKTLISELQHEGVHLDQNISTGRNPTGQFGPQHTIMENGIPDAFYADSQQPPPRDEPEPIPPLIIDEEEIREKQNPIFELFGLRLDIDSTIAIGLGIFVWVYIWHVTGLLDLIHKKYSYLVIFSMFILYSLVNIVTSGSKSGGVVYELNILLTVEQMISILFGTMVVLTLFSEKIPTHPEIKRTVSRILISILMMLSLASMWINVITSGRAFRAIRKTKQSFYNISLALVATIGVLVFNSSIPMSEIIVRPQ